MVTNWRCRPIGAIGPLILDDGKVPKAAVHRTSPPGWKRSKPVGALESARQLQHYFRSLGIDCNDALHSDECRDIVDEGNSVARPRAVTERHTSLTANPKLKSARVGMPASPLQAGAALASHA